MTINNHNRGIGLHGDFTYNDRQLALLKTLRKPGAWGEYAACKGDMLFCVMDDDQKELDKYCRSVCNGCPVIMNCLHHALTFPELTGFWGGRNKYERSALRGKMGKLR